VFYWIILTRTKTHSCRELKILQNWVFFFLKFFIDFKEIANDIINLSLAFFALSQKITEQGPQPLIQTETHF
jgi:hypothetical protein